MLAIVNFHGHQWWKSKTYLSQRAQMFIKEIIESEWAKGEMLRTYKSIMCMNV